MPKRKRYEEVVLVRFEPGTIARLDAVLGEREQRAVLLRELALRELERREAARRGVQERSDDGEA